jgi:hemerythrin
MDIFKWTQAFETGITEVDNQHQHLVQVINQFGALIVQNEIDLIDIDAVFSEMVEYAQYHFESEEKFMGSAGIEPRYLHEHKEEHQIFLQEVSFMHQEFVREAKFSGKHLFEYLVNWLIYHILGSDMSMSRQLNAIGRNISASRAYQAEVQSDDHSKGLLLTALNNLFHQVSHRNRELSDLNRTLEEKVAKRTEALSVANQKLGELASTDVLTGLSNRRHALKTLDSLWLDSVINGFTLSCMMVDADGFKEVNDNFGHDAGDTVLCELARHLVFSVRTDDLVCRMGGDEFLIILPNTDLDGALQIAKNTHARISELKVPVTGGAWKGSISVGVAEKTAVMSSAKELIKSADQGVYVAKKAGKNCVRISSGGGG